MWGNSLRLLFTISAPVPPPHPFSARRGEGHDGGAHLPHPASPLLPQYFPLQHHDVGPPGTAQHPQTLEPELPETRPSSPALSSPVLQGSE